MENNIKKENKNIEETKQEVIEDRHQQLSPSKNEEGIDISKHEKKNVLLSSGDYNTLIKLIDFINSKDVKDFKEDYTQKQKEAIGLNIDSLRTCTHDNAFCDSINEDYVNDIHYGENTLNAKHIKVKGGSAVTGNAAIARFSSALGIGENTNVPLWHSGMWVTIKPPKDSDIINLEIALANNEIKLGKETNTLVYSNYSVIFNRIVTDFIVSHIIATSVKIPDDVDIRDLIKIQDLYILMVGLISTMYPDGYPIIRNCKNTLVMENDIPKCDFTVSADIDPLKLIWVNRRALTPKALEHMSHKRPNSTTIDQVKEYQLLLEANKDKIIELTASNNTVFKMTISVPSLSSYIDHGEAWIDDIITKSEELFTEGDSEEIKNKKIFDILSANILGIYNTYVTKVELEDGTAVTDKVTLNSILDLLSSDESILENFINEIKKFIDTKAIAIIATPSYTCPKCKGENTNETDNKAFKEFLPINMLEHFFDLGALRTLKIRNRNIF